MVSSCLGRIHKLNSTSVRLSITRSGKDMFMSEAEKQLLQLIKERAFKLGKFELASGDTSSYYIDGKMIEVCSEGALPYR